MLRVWKSHPNSTRASSRTCRFNVSHQNLNVVNAILFVAENGCKWHALPKRFANWHTIYTRMNRWAKAGVLDRLFAELQREQLIRIKIEAVSLDSTIVKVHPDGTGALKKRPARYRRHNEIERLFRRLKGFRRIFSRFDKLDLVFIAFIYFALIVEALRE
jgi:transposase